MKTEQPYNLASEFESAVVLHSCSSPEFFARITAHVEVKAFASEHARLLLETAQAIASDDGFGPANPTVVIQRLHRLMQEGRVTLEQIQAASDYLDAAEDNDPPDLNAVSVEFTPILQRRKQYEAVITATEEYAKRGDFSRVTDILEQANAIGRVVQMSDSEISSAATLIQNARHVDRLATGIFDLDICIDGGMSRGQMGVAVGGPGEGKSMFLNHVTCSAVQSGLFALYATLELSPHLIWERMLAFWTGLSNGEIRRNPQAALAQAQQKPLGNCSVAAFTPQATTVKQIIDWVEKKEKQRGRKVDLLVVDYADKLTSARTGGRDQNEYTIMRDVYETLRIFAENRQNWTWTASQAKADGGNKKQIKDVNNMSDSMHKGRVADLVVTLNRREEELLYAVAKNRTGPSGMKIGPLPHDFARGRMVA